ncbi:beta-hexosaminidase subunit alpha-like isoform X2 [Watersipora subatra]|uniref:beta-hexosaminidase subunit alpha-like isoform X2 n=1 Tax=Watersipora subatra TaxID=2589382 RepID=UPI00355BA489
MTMNVLATFSLLLASALCNNFSGNIKIFPPDQPPIRDGLPLPLPRTWIKSDKVFAVLGGQFLFHATGHMCADLGKAFDRYHKMIFNTFPEDLRKSSTSSGKYGYHQNKHSAESNITSLEVNVNQICDGTPQPALGMSETYKLQISEGSAMLSADTLWGALRGLETFSQLVYEAPSDSPGIWMVNETVIEDTPRFQHRGFLLDTSRHYLEKNIILQFVSALAMSKFNVLHWHIVDDQSFPYRSMKFPDLSKKGAYDPDTHIYDQQDIDEVIEFSRQRGIRVIAEFDTPGHTQSWGFGQPGLLTPCYGSDGKPDGTYGPIDPTKNSSYVFLEQLFSEVHQVFPDQYVHLGGDEVSFDCWKSNPDINAAMVKLGIKAGDYAGLESYYISRLTDIVSSIGSKYIVWQEPLDNGVKLANDTVVNIWKTTPQPALEMSKVTAAGYKAISSSCWYLNRIAYGENWQSYYMCDPQDFNGTDTQKALVMGGEGCMWGEWVDGTNVMSRTWPRASVVAERLWSPATATDLDDMKERLEGHRCRMIKRGLDANPIDPSYCRYEKQSPPPLW